MKTARKRKDSETDFGKGKSKFSNTKNIRSNKSLKGITLANQNRRTELYQSTTTQSKKKLTPGAERGKTTSFRFDEVKRKREVFGLTAKQLEKMQNQAKELQILILY